jgi:hypothetical protein
MSREAKFRDDLADERVFPTCRGLATAWIERRGSPSRARRVANAGRRCRGNRDGFTQHVE